MCDICTQLTLDYLRTFSMNVCIPQSLPLWKSVSLMLLKFVGLKFNLHQNCFSAVGLSMFVLRLAQGVQTWRRDIVTSRYVITKPNSSFFMRFSLCVSVCLTAGKVFSCSAASSLITCLTDHFWNVDFCSKNRNYPPLWRSGLAG